MDLADGEIEVKSVPSDPFLLENNDEEKKNDNTDIQTERLHGNAVKKTFKNCNLKLKLTIMNGF